MRGSFNFGPLMAFGAYLIGTAISEKLHLSDKVADWKERRRRDRA